MTPYDQLGFEARLRWGRRGAQRAVELGEVLVVVDVLSFSTAVCCAVSAGVEVYPSTKDEAAALAERLGARLAGGRGKTAAGSNPSLSPDSLRALEPGTRLVLPSPNGSFCSRLGAACPALLLGALVNASAAAAEARRLHEDLGAPVCVLACGERWREAQQGEPLRVALEDALGAGAVLSALGLASSPEAEHCARAFDAAVAAGRIAALLEGCGSGRELIERGFPEDVRAASALDTLACVPRLSPDGSFRERAA